LGVGLLYLITQRKRYISRGVEAYISNFKFVSTSHKLLVY
jgi:hypothetical protein